MSCEETGIYSETMSRIDVLGTFYSKADVVKRYENLDDQFIRICKGEPFKSLKDLKSKATWEKSDIYVHIARNGELLFGGGGWHRLAIAQILNLKTIPVQLGVVHANAIKKGHLRQWRNVSRSNC